MMPALNRGSISDQVAVSAKMRGAFGAGMRQGIAGLVRIDDGHVVLRCSMAALEKAGVNMMYSPVRYGFGSRILDQFRFIRLPKR